jgi:hypothetical protein
LALLRAPGSNAAAAAGGEHLSAKLAPRNERKSLWIGLTRLEKMAKLGKMTQ